MKEIPSGQTITYQLQRRKCNNCQRCREGGPGHGMYWYAYWHETGERRQDGRGYKNGRLVSHYVGKELPDGALEACKSPRLASGGVLSDNDVRDIRTRLANRERGRAIARCYGVSESIISNIKHGKTYREVHP